MPSATSQSSRGDLSPYLIFSVIFAALGPLQFGFHLSELNAPEDVLTCHKKSAMARLAAGLLERAGPLASSMSKKAALPRCIPMDNAAFALVSSSFPFGALLGALASGPIASAKGRVLAMRLTAFFFVLGSLIESVSGSVLAICIGRILSGVSGGATTVIVPMYISEIAPPKDRGFFGVMTQISINVGILITQTLGYFLSHGSDWRWILAAGAMLGLVHLLALFAVPESPPWLAANKSLVLAKRVLQRIRGRHYDTDDEVAAWGPVVQEPEEACLLEDPAADSSQSNTSRDADKSGNTLGFVQVICHPDTQPAIIAVVGIMAAQQLCGVNSIIMYSTSLLAGLLPIKSTELNLLISSINLIVTLVCSPLPDKLGRRKCLLLSMVGQGISALVLAFAILLDFKILSAFTVLAFVGSFGLGLGPVPFMMASELVGQEAVGATQSWALGANYVATFLVAQFFPIVNAALNHKFGGAGWVYFIFAALAALSAVFTYFKVPETKGKRNADEVWGRSRRTD